jgi:hypothetical protein
VKVAGFRVFAFHEGRLQSLVHQYEWERGVNRFRPCMAVAPIFSDDPVLIHPSTLCRYGFHAFYDPNNSELIGYHAVWVRLSGIALAVIVGSGRVVLHQTGWRAQRAEIVGVVATGDQLIDNVIRNHYDVPLCRREDVRALAEKFGSLVADLHLPIVDQQWSAG